MLAVFLFLISVLLIGAFFVGYFNLAKNGYIFTSLSYGVGSAVITLQLFLYFFIFRLSFNNFIYYLFGVEALIGLIFIIRKINWRKKIDFIWQKKYLISIGLGLVIFVFIFFSFIQAISKPIMAYDGIGFWSMRAKILAVDGAVNFNQKSENYLASLGFKNYPWHFSLLEYWLRLLGGTGGFLNLVSWGYFVSLALLLFGFANRWLEKWQACVLALLFVSMPLIFYHSYNNYADLPLAYYATAGFLFFIEWLLANRSASLFFSAIFSGWTIFIKNEGIFYVVAFLFSLLICRFFNLTNLKTKEMLKSWAYLVIPILPWLGMKAFFRLGFSNTDGSLGWHPEIFKRLAESLFISNNWNIWWYIFIGLSLVLIIKIIKQKILFPAWIMFSLASLGIISIYVFTAHYQWAMDNTAISRTLIPLAPMSIILLVFSLSQIKFKTNA